LAAIFILATQMTTPPLPQQRHQYGIRPRLNIIQPKKRVVAANIVPVDAKLVDLTTQAWLIYGTGAFTDCCSYVVAKRADEPLLFVSKDFAHTDIESAR
jgi:ribonuclease VapC